MEFIKDYDSGVGSSSCKRIRKSLWREVDVALL
jgi:hypothetical protein